MHNKVKHCMETIALFSGAVCLGIVSIPEEISVPKLNGESRNSAGFPSQFLDDLLTIEFLKDLAP